MPPLDPPYRPGSIDMEITVETLGRGYVKRAGEPRRLDMTAGIIEKSACDRMPHNSRLLQSRGTKCVGSIALQ